MSEAIHDMEAYTKLTDSFVVQQIRSSQDGHLAEVCRGGGGGGGGGLCLVICAMVSQPGYLSVHVYTLCVFMCTKVCVLMCTCLCVLVCML